MSSRSGARWHALLLMVALLCSTAVPRVFVVCVSADDHVSLEAVFEGDPCETKFIFGARSEAGWPAAACTDMPAIQLAALASDDSSGAFASPAELLPLELSLPRTESRLVPRTRWLDAPYPPRLEQRALRTTVLRL